MPTLCNHVISHDYSSPARRNKVKLTLSKTSPINLVNQFQRHAALYYVHDVLCVHCHGVLFTVCTQNWQ